MAGARVTEKPASRTPRRVRRTTGVDVARVQSQSLLDVIDTVINKGLAVDAEVVLGLADIDLIYLRVGALLAAADRVFTGTPASHAARTPAGRAPLPASGGSIGRQSGRAPVKSTFVTRDLHSAPHATALAPDDTSRSVIRLVLTLVEFVRQLLERQAVRRVREKTLNAEEIERLGTALMRLEATVHDLAERHGIDRADLNLDLGPLGTLR
jgi:gas vesicle protein GvpK/gas vesicle protein GvpA/GvpJ/GvpM family